MSITTAGNGATLEIIGEFDFDPFHVNAPQRKATPFDELKAACERAGCSVRVALPPSWRSGTGTHSVMRGIVRAEGCGL